MLYVSLRGVVSTWHDSTCGVHLELNLPPLHAYAYVAQNTKKTLLKWLLDSLSPDGLRTLSATLRDRRMYAARERRLRDITLPGAFASLTGLDIWHLMGILLPLFRMCFHTRETMVSISWRHMTVAGRWPFASWIDRFGGNNTLESIVIINAQSNNSAQRSLSLRSDNSYSCSLVSVNILSNIK